MKIKILAFGIAKDITGSRFLDFELAERANVGELRTALAKRFPALLDLSALQLAVNCEYAHNDVLLNENDEVALIPPVAGG